MRSRVLVLGGAGYVGSSLCHHLLRTSACRGDDEVVCYDNLRYNNGWALAGLVGSPRFRFVHGDIRDEKKLLAEVRQADVVVHLAALVGAPVCEQNRHEAVEVNRDATRALADMMRGHCRYGLVATTNSGYGQTDGASEVTEESPLNPVSLYARTKAEAEEAFLKFERAASLRLATVFGVSPRMRFDLLVNDWTGRLCEYHPMKKAGLPFAFPIFQPNYCRNYVHVQDVVRAIDHAISGHLAGVFNVGNPDANSTKWELAQAICKTLGVPEEVLTVDDTRADPDSRNYRVSNAKLLATGFRFEHPLEKGIREVAEFCRFAYRHNGMWSTNL